MNKRVIIIGGGVAGLSAGIYGQMNDYDTEILEMHHTPGGQCTAWKREGYTFDYCIHWLVGSSHGPFHDIWRETGAVDETTRMVDLDTYVTIITPRGDIMAVHTDIDQWESDLLALAPEDSGAVRRMCRDMRRVATLKMFGKPPHQRNLIDSARFFLTNIPVIKVFAKHGRETVREYFDQLNFQSDILKERFAGFTEAMDDFSALAFLLTLAWFSQKNAGYPIGGSMPLIMRMAGRYKKLGGTFTGGSRVEKIITRKGRAIGVRMEDGTEKYADVIIGASDLHGLIYELLEGRYITHEIEKAFARWPTFKSIVQISFGINRTINGKDHTCQVMAVGDQIGRTVLTAGYQISNYNHDPVITPAGKCVMKLRYESPFELWEGMEKADYLCEKEQIRLDAIARLEKIYPDVKGHIEVVDIATPLTGVRYTGVWRGAYEGFLPSSTNIGKGMKQTIKGLDNFYLAGQWLYPGGGLPPSAQSGKWAFQLICQKDKKKFKVS